MLDDRAKSVAPLLLKLGPDLSAEMLQAEMWKRVNDAWNARIARAAFAAFPTPPVEKFGTTAWMKQQALFELEFERIIVTGAVFDAYLAEALGAIDDAFAHSASDTKRLSRYVKAQSELKRRFSEAFTSCKTAESVKVRSIATHGAAASAVGGWIISSCIWPALNVMARTDLSALLEEDPVTALERQRLLGIARTTAASRQVVAALHETLGARPARRIAEGVVATLPPAAAVVTPALRPAMRAHPFGTRAATPYAEVPASSYSSHSSYQRVSRSGYPDGW